MSKPLTIWITAETLIDMELEAAERFPRETGGVLTGFWSSATEAVITSAVGPGPRAIHREFSFVPDNDYHVAEVKRIYLESNQVETYLGDWHTHPKGSGRLSKTDMKTLKHIAKSPHARVPHPLMAILSGEKEWKLNAWRYSRTSYFGRVEFEKVTIIVF
jgi:integrative and conjugative element protein (TIGR02256 family)